MEIDQTNGVGTLIVPGDHVNVILTLYVDQIALTTTNTNKTKHLCGRRSAADEQDALPEPQGPGHPPAGRRP